MALDRDTVIAALTPVCGRLFQQASIHDCHRLTAGASAATWRILLGTAEGDRALILRLDAGGDAFSTGVGKVLEAHTQAAAQRAGVAAAEVLEIFDQHPQLGSGYLMTCLNGETLAPRILRDAQYTDARGALTAQCAEALAGIHRVPRSALPDLPELGALMQLDQLLALHRSFAERLPVFELAFRWLRERAPQPTATTLVHGDFRLGNFMVDPQGLVAVLDWELTHLGDPMEDLGWLCVNAWRFGSALPVGGFGEREALYREYERHSGHMVDPVAVHYWELFGTLKWGVICQFQAHAHLSGQVRSVERAAIGRRVAETERDIICLLEASCR